MIDYFIYYRKEQNQWILRNANAVEIGVYTRKDSAVRRIKTLSNGSDCRFVVVLDSSQEKSQSYLLINKTVVLVQDYQQILDYEQSLTNSFSDVESKSEEEFEFRVYADGTVQDSEELPFSFMSDDFCLIKAVSEEAAFERWSAREKSAYAGNQGRSANPRADTAHLRGVARGVARSPPRLTGGVEN